MGSYIDGHKHAAGGIVPFLKIANDVAIAVDQLGTRKGAIAVYVEPWHIDVRDFLDLKKNSGEERRRAHDLFPALWLNDLFMQRVQDDARWTLFDPYEVSELTNLYGKEFEDRYLELEAGNSDITRETISAKGLWKEILRSYFETGNPFLTFKDTANKANPNKHSGVIRSSNLCVTGDTRLHTQFGLVRAKDLEENYSEILASYDHRTDGDSNSYGVSQAKALKMFKTKESADIYEVVTKDGYRIKSTLWHEYYITNGDKVEKRSLKEISVGDKLLIQSDEGQFGQDGNYDLGFLMGMVAGDGTFSYKESKQHSIVHIELYNQDMNLGKMIQKQIDSVISKHYALLENSHKEDFVNQYPKPIQHTKNSQKLRFSNIRLGRVFDEQFNFNGQTKHQVPEIVFKGTKETVKGYLQGLFIADGTVNTIKNSDVPSFAIQLASIKKSLLEEVQILLSNFGIRSKISKMRDAQDKAFAYTTVDGEKRVYSSQALYRLNINGLNAIKFIDDIGFIGAKQTKALDILSTRVLMGYPREGRKSEKFLVEISEINYIGKEDVYDTTQLHNHSLIFNGLVTGNCTEIFQNTSPNHYKIKLTYVDQTTEVFEEEELVTVDSGMRKPAKKITALDSLNGKQVWMVDKEQSDGETAVCNLASINLSKVHTKEDLERVIPTAIRMLDNVIDLNFYPLSKVKKTNERTRAIGLGVMGEAQMLAESKIEWGSTEHFYKIDEVMESVSYYAIKASSDLALEKGKYPNYEGSDWSKGIFPIDNANEEACKLVERGGLFTYTHNWNKLREKVKADGMRNGYLMAVAPTSSISILTGTTQAIEPVYKRKWFEENLSGLIPVVAPNLSPETWEYYTPSYELDQNVLVKAGAIRQKWIDQGQSLNIFITLDKASGKYLNEIYMNAWKYGLKSTYYLRSQSPETSNDVEDRSQECVGCQ
jgi:ribonucleotide reductase alpha subunit